MKKNSNKIDLVFLTVILGMLSVVACKQPQQSQDIVFEGTVGGDLKGHNTIRMYNGITQENDSATIVDGRFAMTVPFSVPTRYMFALEYEMAEKGGYTPFGILVDGPGNIEVAANAEEGFYKAKVTGSEVHKTYEEISSQLDQGGEKINKQLSEKYGEAFVQQPDVEAPEYTAFLNEKRQQENTLLFNILNEAAEKHPNSYGVLFALNRLGRDLDADRLEELYNRFSPDLQQLYEGEKIAANIEGQRQSAIGNTLPDFTLPDAEGNPIAIKAYRGKYVLIDFWASWCGPCIASFPHLRELYKQYGGEKFEIVGISIDSKKEYWHKAMEAHPNPWPQLYDDQNVSEKIFAVTAIPATFLIDPEGKIVAKGLNSEALDKKLDELF
ncbi:redoxin domain-containing protein [Sinomicrobium sp.]